MLAHTSYQYSYALLILPTIFLTYDIRAETNEAINTKRSISHSKRYAIYAPTSYYNPQTSACSLPQQIGTGPYRIPRWYYNKARMRCELFFWSGCCANGNNFPTQHNCQRQCEVDQCRQTLDQGRGDQRLRRYFFNQETMMCEQFTYFGSDGNRNNFRTLAECQQQCPESPNPCAYSSGTPQIPCQGGSDTIGTSCGPNQYCHVGYSPPTTVCCDRPSTIDRCKQVLKIGIGNAVLQRWYFNINIEQCEPFMYRGLQGNENNFLTENDCENACLENPCASGTPYRTQRNVVHCSSSNPLSCPNGYYCHLGAQPSTTVCCPNLGGKPCEQPMSNGKGNYQLQRWYWNVANQQCLPFVYGGLKGTQNNFPSQQYCETACYEFENPCSQGAPQAGVGNRPISCSSTQNTCSNNHWCHIGASPRTCVCCPGKVEGQQICRLPLATGRGNANLPRWYFDQNTQKCTPFSYGGIYGNQNNFLTQTQCHDVCPGYVNPCATGNPQLEANGRPVSCSFNHFACASNYWCHVGADSESTLCCPGRVDGSMVCRLSMAVGLGSANLQRWYFDHNSQKCLPFMYGGLYGNQNNFVTQQLCEKACPVSINPCALGTPQLGPDNRPLKCSTTQNPCGSNYWCHIGAVPQTTVCCPGKEEGYAICQQTMAVGSGNGNLQRWYFDSKTRQCVPFTYGGLYGNQNNFNNKQLCEQSCPAYVNVCPQGVPMLEANNQPRICTFGKNSCGPDYWCHLGLVPSEYNCCPGEETNPAACQGLPAAPGALGAPVGPATRWYYNSKEMTCQSFEYNGRKGNQNNFLTRADCAATCKVYENPCTEPITLPARSCSTSSSCPSGYYCHFGLTPDYTICCPYEGNRCLKPASPGIGGGSQQRWYFNSQRGICVSFTYRGMKGNANNFLSRQTCEQTCRPNPCRQGMPYVNSNGVQQVCDPAVQADVCPRGYWCNPGGNSLTTLCCPGAVTNFCNLPVLTGEGNAQLQRYYYDTLTRSCRGFTYRGSKGNQNNFISLSACQQQCQPLENPCIGQPATTAAGQILFCAPTNKEMCPVNFWCHVGASPVTTVCCPGATNPCSVPLSPGTGNASLHRWYYNSDDRDCLPFLYNGIRGNQNNFESQAECSRTCPVRVRESAYTNPCIGHIARSKNGRPLFCSPLKTNTCPKNYFCLAAGRELQGRGYCCLKQSSNPCSIFMSEGNGDDELQRWYYNIIDGVCQPFVYRGRKGNENNFLSKELCEAACEPDRRTCYGGASPYQIDGRTIICVKESCPSSYYCHVGANKKTTVCCPREGFANVCDLPLITGNGNNTLSRWYYNKMQEGCLPFDYKGTGGNENNFLSKTVCENTCASYQDACPVGGPILADSTITSCTTSNECPKNYVCQWSQKWSRAICCPGQAPIYPCISPNYPGPCFPIINQQIIPSSSFCQQYRYGGCLGNLYASDYFVPSARLCCNGFV